LVWHLREFLEEDQNRKIWCKNYGFKLINRSDAVIAISKSVYTKYVKKIDVTKLHLIYNGIDIKKYYKKNRSIFKDECTHLLFVGQLNEKKGCFTLIDACNLLKQQGYKFQIVFLGKRNKEFDEKLSNSNIMDRISYTGYVSNTPDYYEKADISFMCSQLEAFGRVIVEGMMSGTLIIGSNSGCTKEIIKHGKTGLLYTVDDEVNLFKTIKFAIDNKNLMRIIAEEGNKEALSKFTSEKNAAEIINVYKKVSCKSKERHKISTLLFIMPYPITTLIRSATIEFYHLKNNQ
jgi:hypothetical protein